LLGRRAPFAAPLSLLASSSSLLLLLLLLLSSLDELLVPAHAWQGNKENVLALHTSSQV
jgi:hypothetical protein